MSDTELDRRLAALLRADESAPDPAFVERLLAAARLDMEIRKVRGRVARRVLTECAAAVTVAGTFFLLSQEQMPLPGGMMTLQGPAMAGLVMLGLWAVVSLPTPGGLARAS